MAFLSQLSRVQPLTIDPMQRDLDQPIMRCLDDVEPLSINGEDVGRFLDWVEQSSHRGVVEGDLQELAERDAQPLLTACLPLVTFRYELCSGGRHMQNEDTSALMERLVAATREWRAAGVDTVAVSGYRLAWTGKT